MCYVLLKRGEDEGAPAVVIYHRLRLYRINGQTGERNAVVISAKIGDFSTSAGIALNTFTNKRNHPITKYQIPNQIIYFPPQTR
jgi:hypothetical protein